MHHFVKIFFSLALFSSLSAVAKIPMDFPAEKNNVQVLPQKFEYSLRDNAKLLLGNRIIDTNEFRFRLFYEDSKPQVYLAWPSQVVQEGRLLITNPSGISVWSQPITKSQSEFRIKDATTLVRALSGLSFFRFCVGYYDIDTGLDVCSPEIYLKGTDRNLTTSLRSTPQKAFVQINGRNVTHHGIVFLNDEKESLSFRAVSSSGAEFKMDTRRIKLEFPDVQDLDEKGFVLTIKGPLPLAPTNFKKLGDGRWSVPLLKERAQIYIEGEGKVPLRQEFIVLGRLPTNQHRVHLYSSLSQKTYLSQMMIIGEPGKLGNLKTLDASSEISRSGSQFQWYVRNIPPGMGKTSYLGVEDKEQVFQAAYTTSRQDSARIELGAYANSDDMILGLSVEAQLWFETALLKSVMTYQRFGLSLQYAQDLSSDVKTTMTELDLLFRNERGLQFWDTSIIFGFGFQNWSFDSESLSTFAPVVSWVSPAFPWTRYFDWQEMDLRFSLPTKKSNLELTQAVLLKWKLYKSYEEGKKIKVGLGLRSLETDVNNEKSQSVGLLLEAGWVRTF